MAEQSFLDKLVDFGTGVVKRIADFELDKRSFELLLAREARAAEGEANAARVGAQVQAQQSFSNLIPILVLAGVGLAGAVILKKIL